MRRSGCRKKYFRFPAWAVVLVLSVLLLPAVDAYDIGDTEGAEEPVYTETPVFLSCGDRGAAVSALQDHLRTLGYDPGTTDGVYTLTTAQAVKAFEADMGLYTDGVCSAAVAAAAAYLCEKQHAASLSYDREALCTALASCGCPVMGEDTQSMRNALMLFQRTNGLYGTGETDMATLYALGLVPIPDTADTGAAYADLCITVLSDALRAYAQKNPDSDLHALLSYGDSLLSDPGKNGEGMMGRITAECRLAPMGSAAACRVPAHVIRRAAEELVRRYAAVS